MLTGTIKFYDTEKAYGFIKADADGKEIFFHISGVATGYEPAKGDKVTFDTTEGKKGLNAISVGLSG